MKITQKARTQQRQLISKRVSKFSRLDWRVPPVGWISAVRTSLGMTINQLGMRLGQSAASVAQIEKREGDCKVTLETMSRAAKAMNCRFVYAIIPDEEFEDLEAVLEHRAFQAALRLIKEVSHSMKLEQQDTSKDETKYQLQRVVRELINNNDSRIWDHQKQKQKKNPGKAGV